MEGPKANLEVAARPNEALLFYGDAFALVYGLVYFLHPNEAARGLNCLPGEGLQEERGGGLVRVLPRTLTDRPSQHGELNLDYQAQKWMHFLLCHRGSRSTGVLLHLQPTWFSLPLAPPPSYFVVCSHPRSEFYSRKNLK